MKQIIAIFFILFCHPLWVQATDTLSLRGFLSIVKKYHPVARQSDILIDKAAAELLGSRAGFDPVLSAGAEDKTFNGLNYYRGNNTQLSIPTWYGIEINTGLQYLAGTRNNPEETVGSTSYAGISIPLAKNLLMDKRRAALQQAKLMQKASYHEREVLLNNLLLDAVHQYWQWVQTFAVFKAYERIIEVNRSRYLLVQAAFKNGERPAIDTTEALTQLQQFEYLQNEAWMAWQNSGIGLSNFLWTERTTAYQLPPGVEPAEDKNGMISDEVTFPELEQLLTNAQGSHPELLLYNFKLQSLQVEKKLKFQELLPKIDLKYNQLGKGFDLSKTTVQPLLDNNYKYGISFSVPLRLSSGRAGYKLARLKLKETTLQQAQKQNDIANKIRNYYNQLVTYKNQVALLQRSYGSFLQLQKAEETRFLNGESSLFLINSRENKALEVRLKLLDALTKLQKTSWSLQWAAGSLWML